MTRGLDQTVKALSWGGSPRDLLRQQDQQRGWTHRQNLQFLWIINATQGRSRKTEPQVRGGEQAEATGEVSTNSEMLEFPETTCKRVSESTLALGLGKPTQLWPSLDI